MKNQQQGHHTNSQAIQGGRPGSAAAFKTKTSTAGDYRKQIDPKACTHICNNEASYEPKRNQTAKPVWSAITDMTGRGFYKDDFAFVRGYKPEGQKPTTTVAVNNLDVGNRYFQDNKKILEEYEKKKPTISQMASLIEYQQTPTLTTTITTNKINNNPAGRQSEIQMKKEENLKVNTIGQIHSPNRKQYKIGYSPKLYSSLKKKNNANNINDLTKKSDTQQTGSSKEKVGYNTQTRNNNQQVAAQLSTKSAANSIKDSWLQNGIPLNLNITALPGNTVINQQVIEEPASAIAGVYEDLNNLTPSKEECVAAQAQALYKAKAKNLSVMSTVDQQSIIKRNEEEGLPEIIETTKATIVSRIKPNDLGILGNRSNQALASNTTNTTSQLKVDNQNIISEKQNKGVSSTKHQGSENNSVWQTSYQSSFKPIQQNYVTVDFKDPHKKIMIGPFSKRV